MSATTLTIGSVMNGPSSSNGSTVQPSSSTSPPSSGIGTQTSVATPTKTAVTPSTTLPTFTSTPPTSRPSTPSISAATPQKPSSSKAASADKLRLNRLSHISVATWMGVGLTLAGLVVAVYYGIPVLRLAIWTAKNDFREACKSELDTALPQTSACKAALDQPPQPPPIKKRGITVVGGHGLGLKSSVLATCCILLVLLSIVVKNLTRCGRKDVEQSKNPVGFSTSAHSLSERDALMRLLFDTAQRLEVEGDEWELPAELKVELITMIEQNGSQTTTGRASLRDHSHSLQEHISLRSQSVQDTQLPRLRKGSSIDRVPLLENASWLMTPAGDFLVVKGAKFLLRRAGLPITLSFIFFIASNVYTEGRFYHWSGISQWWSPVWKAVRILLSFVAVFEGVPLDSPANQQLGIANLPAVSAVLMGLSVVVWDALKVRFGQKESTLNIFSIMFLICTLLFSAGILFIAWDSVNQVRLVQLLLALPVFCGVLMIFMIELG